LLVLAVLGKVHHENVKIFPTAKEIHNPPTDGIYKATISHSALNQQLQPLCPKVLVLPLANMLKIICQRHGGRQQASTTVQQFWVKPIKTI
jgi:hypothetical protein